jgi:hypothetical protein
MTQTQVTGGPKRSGNVGVLQVLQGLVALRERFPRSKSRERIFERLKGIANNSRFAASIYDLALRQGFFRTGLVGFECVFSSLRWFLVTTSSQAHISSKKILHHPVGDFHFVT